MVDAFWKPARLLLLAGVFGGMLWVLSRAIAAPKAVKEEVPLATTTLPETIPLEGWNLQATKLLSQGNDLPSGQEYQYRQNSISVTVQARLMVSDGNISRLLFVHTPIRAANAGLQIRQRLGVGYYGILAHDHKAYLSACVNSRGESTVTEPQFMQNRYKYDLQVNRVLPWILGRAPLLDQRCLWTLMATPLPAAAKNNPAVANQSFEALENAWFSWHQWWKLNFPPV